MLCVTLCFLSALCVKKRCKIIFLLSFLFSINLFSQNVVITSHRGAAAFAPENTLLSVQKALEAGAKRIEIDVRMTADTILVLMHDKKINRTTDCKGKVCEKKYSEIEKCNAGFDQEIPALGDVLALVSGKAELVIDIKQGGALYEKELISEIEKYKASSWCILSSFKINVLRRIHKIDSVLTFHRSLLVKLPFIPVFIKTGIFIGGIKRNDFISEYNCYYSFISRHLIEKLHRKNKKINAWTIDKKSKCLRVIEKGVDGIVSNNPLVLKEN